LNDQPALRPVTPDDRSFLLALYRSVRADELAAVEWEPEQLDAFVESQFDAQDRYYRASYDPATFDVIVLDDCPIGRLYVARWPDEIRIIDITIHPDLRGRGIGHAVLGSVLAEAGRAGKPVTVHVEHGNPAFALYERLGFAPKEDRGIHLFMEWRPTGGVS
jgi:ribosomal protein S18 acetylase RimI-like enzyme